MASSIPFVFKLVDADLSLYMMQKSVFGISTCASSFVNYISTVLKNMKINVHIHINILAVRCKFRMKICCILSYNRKKIF
jgi:hypothetical protein